MPLYEGRIIRFFLTVSTVLILVAKCEASCYFSAELQGTFAMQMEESYEGKSQGVLYNYITVTEDSIAIWGTCHKRIGNNVILNINTGGGNCIRCFHIKLRSRNVLQVHAKDKDYMSKCSTNEKTAIANCPNEDDINNPNPRRNNTEIMLYKVKERRPEGEMTDISKVYCPINGRFTFTYNLNDGSESKIECPTSTSELDSCPSGSALNLRFKQCSFENHKITIECLGHWKGRNNQNFLAFENRMNMTGPQYQCAIYHENPVSGVVNIAFSNDSTCTNMLHNSQSGFQTLTLTPVKQEKLPYAVESSTCRFPSWMIGHWEHISVKENVLIYKDHSSFKTYTFFCAGGSYNNRDNEKFMVYGRTQCHEEMYSCLWVKKRSTNVLEFQLSRLSSPELNSSLCESFNFDNDTWITQGRLERKQESPCPISGEYRGTIPDATGLCAKMSSNCQSPDIMYFEISTCTTMPEIYEEREYRCLGQWEENNVIYTYTQRVDIGTYECFVGKIISNNEIYIREAGEHCHRTVDIERYGMKLNKEKPCESRPSIPRTTIPTTLETSTERRTPITEPPKVSSASRTFTTSMILLGFCLIVRITY